jgi:hypothetical protein
MLAPRTLTRLTRAGALVAAAATMTALVTALGAAPAHAAGDPVTVRIGGLASNLRSGKTDSFTITLRNETPTPYLDVRRVFVVQLDGLTADGVRIVRAGTELAKSVPGPGQVMLTDPAPVTLGSKGATGSVQTWTYQIQFLPPTTTGPAQLAFAAYSGGTRLGAALGSISVTGTASPSPSSTTASPTPSPTDSPTPAASPTDSPTAGPDLASLDPQPTGGHSGSSSGIPTLFYVFGLALLGAGGVIMWLLFRRPGRDEDRRDDGPFVGESYRGSPYAVVHQPPRYPSPAGPGLGHALSQSAGPTPGPRQPYAAPTYPTAVMPAVPTADTSIFPVQPVDPWAGAPMVTPDDATRDFGARPPGRGGPGPGTGGLIGQPGPVSPAAGSAPVGPVSGGSGPVGPVSGGSVAMGRPVSGAGPTGGPPDRFPVERANPADRTGSIDGPRSGRIHIIDNSTADVLDEPD